jgi:hypothetical protein
LGGIVGETLATRHAVLDKAGDVSAVAIRATLAQAWRINLEAHRSPRWVSLSAFSANTEQIVKSGIADGRRIVRAGALIGRTCRAASATSASARAAAAAGAGVTVVGGFAVTAKCRDREGQTKNQHQVTNHIHLPLMGIKIN